jgi:hypothetical protein
VKVSPGVEPVILVIVKSPAFGSWNLWFVEPLVYARSVGYLFPKHFLLEPGLIFKFAQLSVRYLGLSADFVRAAVNNWTCPRFVSSKHFLLEPGLIFKFAQLSVRYLGLSADFVRA